MATVTVDMYPLKKKKVSLSEQYLKGNIDRHFKGRRLIAVGKTETNHFIISKVGE